MSTVDVLVACLFAPPIVLGFVWMYIIMFKFIVEELRGKKK